MPLTPADVHSISFKKAPIGNRGYDEDEVDNFLDEVERELDRLIETNNKLRAQNEQLATGAPPGAAENAELLAEFERLQHEKSRAEQALQVTQDEVEELRRNGAPAAPAPAAAAAGPADNGGEQQALKLLMVAQRTADDHLDTARTEADTVLNDARTQAEDMVTKARNQAETLEKESQQQHQEVMTKLESKRAALQKHIEELKTFERQYRTRLKAYLESQLRDLTGRGEGVVDVDAAEPTTGELRQATGNAALTGADGMR